jgi:hypothetical protein
MTKRKVRKEANVDNNDKDMDKDNAIDKNNEDDQLLPKGDNTWRDITGNGSSVDEIFDDADFGGGK